MSARKRLAEIDANWSDDQVAALIAEVLTESEREPYCFVMNHNAGKPDYLACPLRYDFTFQNQVGIETMFKGDAMTWLVKALKLGYVVSAAGPEIRRHSGLKPKHPYGDTYSIKRARERADIKRRVLDDDDIPF